MRLNHFSFLSYLVKCIAQVDDTTTHYQGCTIVLLKAWGGQLWESLFPSTIYAQNSAPTAGSTAPSAPLSFPCPDSRSSPRPVLRNPGETRKTLTLSLRSNRAQSAATMFNPVFVALLMVSCQLKILSFAMEKHPSTHLYERKYVAGSGLGQPAGGIS